VEIITKKFAMLKSDKMMTHTHTHTHTQYAVCSVRNENSEDEVSLKLAYTLLLLLIMIMTVEVTRKVTTYFNKVLNIMYTLAISLYLNLF
jgi:hypothetical protein